VQTVVNTLVWCWAGALLLGVAWFLVQPLLQPRLFPEAPAWLRWAVAGGLVGTATVLGLVVGVLRAPSKLVAALSLDEKFGLKERVTTSLTLAPTKVATPAGQALLEDVNHRIGKLDVGERFPVRMSWSATLVPAGAALLAVVAIFYKPNFTQATITP